MTQLQQYSRKTPAELYYIIRDASEAAALVRNTDPSAEAKYLDQVNDAMTVIARRKGK